MPATIITLSEALQLASQPRPDVPVNASGEPCVQLPRGPLRETKQAFLSGIHWLATSDSYDPDEIQRALRSILSADNPFISR